MKSKVILSLLLLLPCVSACELMGGNNNSYTPEEVKVRVVEAGPADGEGTVTYLGSAQSSKTAFLTASAPGKLQSMNVRQGQKVHRGDVLAVLLSESVNSALEIASATLAQAEDGYGRMMIVYEKGGITDIKKMEVETQLRTARAAYLAASSAKEQCTLRAPFDGTVEEVIAHAGEELGLLAPILKITDTEQPEIHFNVPEREIESLAVGDQVQVEIPALEESLPMQIGLISASGNLLSHSYDCAIYPDKTINGLRPGMVVKVHRWRRHFSDRIAIPVSAVFTGMDGRYVWVVENGIVQKRTIIPDGYTEDGIVVSEGLRPGDLVIVEGARKVCSGMNVKTER